MFAGSLASATTPSMALPHFAQVFARGSDVDVHHALDLVVIDLGRRFEQAHVHHVVEHRDGPLFGRRWRDPDGTTGQTIPAGPHGRRIRRRYIASLGHGRGGPALQARSFLHPAAQRNLLQIDQVVDRRRAVLVVLHRQEVVVAGLVVHPVIRRDHGVGVQRGDDVVHDLLLAQAQFRGVNPVDVEAQRRIVHVLRNVDFADARQAADALRQHLRGAEGLIADCGWRPARRWAPACPCSEWRPPWSRC